MTPASKSVYFFGIYLIVLGIVLITIPNTLLLTLQLPETNEVWIRVVGVLVFSIGMYYVYLAPQNNNTFLALTAYVRASIMVWFILFVMLDWVPPQLILFGVIDLIGAIWTFMALRRS